MTAQVRKSAEILVSRDKALADYLALGSSRSLTKLYQSYTDTGLKSPAISTLKGWSSAFGWQQQAAEYDRQVEKATQEVLTQKQAMQQAEEAFDVQDGIGRCVKIAMLKAQEALEKIDVKSISDVQRCVHICRELLEMESRVRDSHVVRKGKTRQEREEEARREGDEMLAILEENFQKMEKTD